MEGLSKIGLNFNNTVITLFQSVLENIARGLSTDRAYELVIIIFISWI